MTMHDPEYMTELALLAKRSEVPLIKCESCGVILPTSGYHASEIADEPVALNPPPCSPLEAGASAARFALSSFRFRR
jgi:hypothetical protein